MNQKMNELKAQAIQNKSDFLAALKAEDIKAMTSAEEALTKTEKEFKEESFLEYLNGLKAQPRPELAALQNPCYGIIKHRQTKDGKSITGIELYETDQKMDIVSVFKHLGLPTESWKNGIIALNYLFTLKAAVEHGLESDNFNAIRDNYVIAKEIRETLKGGTPTSNTQLLKRLQDIIDQIIIIPDENGGNSVKAQKKDINALYAWHQSKDKRVIGGTDVATDKAFIGYVVEVINRILTHADYKLIGKTIGNKDDAKGRHDVFGEIAETPAA